MSNFSRFMVLYTLMAVLVIGLGSCKDAGKVIDDPEFNYRSGERVVLRVHLFDTREELNVAYKALANKDQSMLGFSIAQRNIATREPSFCDIFVLRTPYASNRELQVWGHEVKHCLEGSFHKEGLDR